MTPSIKNIDRWPSYSDEEIAAVNRVLSSGKVNYWTGDECRSFEKEFASWCGTKYAVALANGTLALDLALNALDIGVGDEVVVTSRTFIASVSCIVNAGAKPIFADLDRDSGNITVDTISQVLSSKTKAIICVHLAGWPCDMDPIMELAQKLNIMVIEDCAQAHGARYKGRSVGSIGQIGAWSFCQDKIMTTGGEGGMVTTNNEALWRKMWAFKDHGKSYEAIYEREHLPGFRWVHESFGTNWRMLEIQAAIGRIQLKRMLEWTDKRRRNAKYLLGAFKQLRIIRAPEFRCNKTCAADCANSTGCNHAFYKCYVYIEVSNLKKGWSRDRIIDEVYKKGIPCFQGACPEVYLEKAFDSSGLRPNSRLPVAKELGETSLMFLVHPTLTQENLEKIAEILMGVLKNATL
jgi:dTDP-4-amino-4,6-dideoxygalactose transaminase